MLRYLFYDSRSHFFIPFESLPKMDRQLCSDATSLFHNKHIFCTMSMPSGYISETPLRFQDGSIITCSSNIETMINILQETDWCIDSVAKMMLQMSTILDHVNGDSRVKLFSSPDQGLILELYRDRMMALGWSYPPLTRFDIRNRSCWATEFSLLPTTLSNDHVGYWVWFYRSINDPNAYDKHHMTLEKLNECIALGDALERGETIELYGRQVDKQTLLGHPSRRRLMRNTEIVFFWEVKLYLRDSAYRFWRIYGAPDEIARVDNTFILSHLPSIPPIVAAVASRVEISPNCERISEFMPILCRSLPQDPPPYGIVDGLTTPLKPFQTNVVEWMVRREEEPFQMFYPVGEAVYYSPLVNYWRNTPFSMSGGGFLCSEFGMGKTIMCFALCLRRPGQTLVITTTTLLSQWKKELNEKTNLRVGVYHGAKKHEVDMESYDVVLTTYGIIRSRNSNSILIEKAWHRVILDESHHIKSAGSVTANCVYALRAANKWCVSATPIQTRIQDFYGQLRFFNKTEWTPGIWKALFRSREVFQRGNRLSYLLQQLCHAHTRDQTYGNGEAIISLPSIRMYPVEISLPLEYHEEYNNLCDDGMLHSMSMGELMGIVEKIRRYCSNGSIRHRRRQLSNNSASSVVPSIAAVVEDRSCPICLEQPEQPVITRCQHILCSECASSLFRYGRHVTRCPLCRQRIEQSQTRLLVEEKEEEERPAPPTRPTSIKLLAVFDTIENIRSMRPLAKIVVFSQYLETLQQLIKMSPYDTCHIRGSTPQKKRATELEKFQTDPHTILLLSMRSGACGINLTTATDVILVEPAVNEGLEDQAVGRLHRIGQTSDVHVHKLILRSTIEEKILRIRRREGFVGHLKKDCRLSRSMLLNLLG